MIKTTLLELFQSQKSSLKARSHKTTYNDFVLARREFLRLVRAPIESLSLIIIYYMIKYGIGKKKHC